MIRWMDWTMQQLNIPQAATDQPVQDWAVDGPGFVQLTEDQFKEKLPQQVSQSTNTSS